MPKNKYFSVLPHLLPKNDQRYKKWRKSLKNKVPWNKGKNKNNNPSVKKISDTFKKKKLDNFFKWRENARSHGLIPKTYNQLERNVNLAFLIGLTLGDGNIYVFPRTECLRIALGTDKPNLWKYAAKIVESVFNKKPNVHKRSYSNCINITLYQKQISKRLGIPSGARKELRIKLPNWIWNNRQMLISAIKGLFEAEGSFSVHKKTYTYNLSFSNVNKSLLDEVEKAIKTMGFHPERREKAVRLRKKNEVYVFQELISFRSYPLI